MPRFNRSQKPPQSTVYCSTDASWKSNSAGLAWIFYNQPPGEHSAELGHKGLSLRFVSSPCKAEALAIRGALLHASNLDITNICIRLDSQELIRAINQRKWTIEFHRVLSDITSLAFSPSSPFSFCRFVFISRVFNGPADRLSPTLSIVFLNLLGFRVLNEF